MSQTVEGHQAFAAPAGRPAVAVAHQAIERFAQSQLAGAILAAAIAMLLAAIPFWLRHRAYFHDDMQSQYIPVLVAIGRSLAAGDWPSLTLQLGLGGALVGEYQFALFNPIELLKTLAVGQFSDAESAAAFLVSTDYAVLGAAVFLLARRLGASSPWALLAASTIVCNNFIFYWSAVSWRPGLSSMGYVLLACTFLMDAAKSRAAFAVAIACVFLTFTAGWPQAIMALGVFALFQLAGDLRRERRRAALTRLGALAIGALLAAPAVLPLLAMGQIHARADGIFNDGMFQPNLYSILALSSPFQMPQIKSFNEYVTVSVPIFFLAWFVLPFCALFDLAKVRKMPYVTPLLLGAAVLIVMTQGPQQLGPLRFPFRFLAYFHVVVMILFAIVATKAPVRVTPRQMTVATAVMAFQALVTWQTSPRILPFAIGALLLTMIALHAAAPRLQRRSWQAPLILGAVGAMLFGITHTLMPVTRDLPDWGARAEIASVEPLGSIPQHYTAVIGTPQDDVTPATAQPFANMRLLHGEASVFGYSPIGYDRWALIFNNMTHGPARLDSLPNHLGPTEHGGLPFVDLAKIDKLVLLRARRSDLALTEAAGFTCDGGGKDAWVCTRSFRPQFPGSIGYKSPDLAITAAGAGSATREVFEVAAGGGTGTLAFNRLAWPGYRATLDGAPLSLGRDRFGLLTVAIPKNRSGVLELTYVPAGLRLGLMAALLGAILGLALIAWGRLWPRVCLLAGKSVVLRQSTTHKPRAGETA